MKIKRCRNGRQYPRKGHKMTTAEYVAAFLAMNHYKE